MEALLEKASILDTMETEYQAFVEMLAPLDGWQLTTPGATEAGSIKDVLAHLTARQKHLLTILQAACQGTEPTGPIRHLSGEDVDGMNREFYAAARARPLQEVWAAFRVTYKQVQEAVEALCAETIMDSEQIAWLHGLPLRDYIAGNTYEHYQEHGLWIRAWLSN